MVVVVLVVGKACPSVHQEPNRTEASRRQAAGGRQTGGRAQQTIISLRCAASTPYGGLYCMGGVEHPLSVAG